MPPAFSTDLTAGPPRRRTAASLLAALLPLAGCSRGDVQAAAPAVQRIVPVVAADAAPEGPVTVHGVLRPPRGLAPWTAEARRVQVGPLPGFSVGVVPDALLMWGPEEKRVTVPGPLDPATFNRVSLTVILRLATSLRVDLEREGAPVASSGWMEVEQSDEPQQLVARFARNATEREPYDALVIRVAPEAGGPVCLCAVELARVPFERWVLGADGAPRLAAIGQEYRRAVGIASSVPREALLVAEPGAELRFSYGLEPELRFPRGRPRLQVVLEAAGAETRIESLPLERGASGATRWRSARLPLEEFGGREVSARFELVDDGSGAAYGYLGELRVERPSARAATVLLVTSDTHRADHLGAAAAGVAVETPALDALAARGVLFERAWSTTNITLPSHVALLTGAHPRDTRIVDNLTPVSDEALTLAEVFRERGYRTWAAVSARHLGPDRSGLGQGFERVAIPALSLRKADDALADVEGWLPDAEGQPLFLWLHLFDAHTPYEPPEELSRRYSDRALGMPTDGAALSHLDQELCRERAAYRGEVTFLDRELGRLLSRPRFRDGLVAVTADHGECLGQHDVYYDHAELYPDTVRVPLILAWPGAPAGARVESAVQNHALGATLLELAGIPARGFPGRSLLTVLDAPAVEPVFTLAYAGESASITHGERHLILHLRDHRIDKGGEVRVRRRHVLELYDLAGDPACERELSGAQHAQARELRLALVRWLASAGDSGWARPPTADPEYLAQLAKLGYAGDAAPGDGPWIDPECACERCASWR